LRILHIDSGREMRGGQWQTVYLMEGLAALGHEQLLLAIADSPLAREAARRGLSTSPLTMPTLARRARKFDLTHAHSARAHALAAPFGHGRLIVARRVAFALKNSAASRWKYRHVAHFIAVSEFVRAVLTRDGIAETNVSVVFDGVPLPPTPAVPKERLTLALDSGDPLKGRTIIERAADLARVPVYFSSHLPAYLPHAALFVYITESEGLGSAALMASAHGVPVVASRVGGLPEAVEDGITGLLTANDPAAVATAMTRILDNRALAAEMAANGRARVTERFTIEAMVRGTLAVYEKVLACSKR
jgi:hypothetical protein